MNELYLHHHLGMGDHIMCNAIVRYYCSQYDKVYLFILTRNLQNVSYMFRDLLNIKYITIDNSEYSAQFKVVNSYRMLNPNINYIKVGYDYLYNTELPADQAFYKQLNLPWETRYDKFYIKRNKESEEKCYNYYNKEDEPFIFIHHDTDRGKNIDFNYIQDKSLKIIEINFKISDPKLFNIFDYMKLLENAKEIHVIDSSFKCLIDSFLLNKKGLNFHITQPVKDTTTCNKSWNKIYYK